MTYPTETRKNDPVSNSRDPNTKLTLLLDLDNTLLDSNLDTFIPAYFKALSDFLKDQVDPELTFSALLSGTRKMMASSDPIRTLQQVFDAEFFAKIGIVKEKLQPRIDQFYRQVLPTLSDLTDPRPEAIKMISWAREMGAEMAIATNPVFPLTVVHQRMRWAGLPPEKVPFSIVSAYETFHFTKPSPAYFAEVLGRMGWPEGPVLMVGDDIDRDLPGSNALGLPTYWVDNAITAEPAGIKSAGRGSISDLRPWLEGTDLSTLTPDFSTPEALISLMLSTPAVITGTLNHLLIREQVSDAILKQHPISNEWSLTEIFCHLRDTEVEINLPRLRMLLELEEPFIPARDSDSWAVKRNYQSQNAIQALYDFTSVRLETVNLLRNLNDEWNRKARHAIFGPTNLRELVKFMAEHDKLHIRQILSTVEHLSG